MGHGQAGPGSGAGMMHGGMRMHGGHFDIERMKDEDPEMYALVKGDQDLERATFDLSNRYRQTMKSEDREKIKAELQAAVEKHFMVRQQKRELELKRLEEQLTRMKESVAKRLAEKGPIIEQRVKDLTGEQDSGF
jgi:phosphomevalonate kinase